MLICGDCSSRNKDGESFCSNCGAYLVWQREPVEARETPSADKPRPVPPSGPTVNTVQIPTIPLPSDQKQEHAPGRGYDAGRHNESVPATPQGRRTAPGVREDFPSVITAQKRTDTTGIGVDRPDAAKTAPVEVKPGYRISQAPDGALPRHDEAAPAPGQLICGRCGAGNNRERKFCRRCAASLDEAAVALRPPWWRRFLNRPSRAPLPAGTRPPRKQWRFPFRLVSSLAMLSLVAGALYLFRGPVIDVVTRVQDNRFSSTWTAQRAQASAWAPDRGPEYVIDGFKDTSWAAAVPGNTGDQYLEVFFEREFRLTYLFFSSGAPNEQNVFTKERRPIDVEIRATGKVGEPIIRTLKLADVAERQRFYVGADGVSAVRITILTSEGPADAPVAVAEVQFMRR